jgi:hypothetical protein
MSARAWGGLAPGFFEKLQRLDLAFHDAVHSGDPITRGMLDLEGCAASSKWAYSASSSLPCWPASAAGGLIATDPVLGATTLIFLPFVAVMAGTMGLKPLCLDAPAGTHGRPHPRDGGNLRGRAGSAFPARSHQIAAFDAAGNAALAWPTSASPSVRARWRRSTWCSTARWPWCWRWAVGASAKRATIGDLAAFPAYMTIPNAGAAGMIANAAAAQSHRVRGCSTFSIASRRGRYA